MSVDPIEKLIADMLASARDNPGTRAFTNAQIAEALSRQKAAGEAMKEALERIANWREESAEYTDQMGFPRRAMDETQIMHIDAANQLAVVEPGVVNVALTRAASAHGLHYAPDPSSQTACTIGGNVAENAGGPHCLKYGVTLNHVLALTVILPAIFDEAWLIEIEAIAVAEGEPEGVRARKPGAASARTRLSQH
jgi:hypothetical protein